MDLMLGETSMRMPCQGVALHINNDCLAPTRKRHQNLFHVDTQLFPRYLSVPVEKPWHSSWLPYLRVRKNALPVFFGIGCDLKVGFVTMSKSENLSGILTLFI